jgi:aspartate/methionine/tyrosine aminotransferase
MTQSLQSLAGRFDRDLQHMDAYQRMIQYWGVMFDRRNGLAPLDCMNFSLGHFPEVLRVSDVAAIHALESGYASPDGGPELGALIRYVEYARLQRHSPHRERVNRALVEGAGVGCGAGTTGAIMGVMNAIARLPKRVFPRANDAPEVVVPVPNYPVCAAQHRHMRGLTPRYVHARAANGYLPTFDEIAAAVTDRTVQITLTYPNNPGQATYEGERLDDLRALVRFCQEKGIFLLVDNIYQELVYGRRFEEVFAHTDRLDYVVKFYGPSKDTPFFAGYRIGYWFGDPRLQEPCREHAWVAENSANPLSMALFGVNLLLRAVEALGEPLAEDHMRFLQDGMFGWGQRIDRAQALERITETRLVERFHGNLDHAVSLQREAIGRVRAFVRQSRAFSECVNEDIGNVCLLRVDPEVFPGSDVELFELLCRHGVAVLPGNAFGLPITRGHASFRMTLVHEPIGSLVRRLERVDEVLTAHLRRPALASAVVA